MTKQLFLQAMAKFALGVVLVGLLIFLPAGTWHYWQGQLFMVILFLPMFLAGLVMMAKNPRLLANRLKGKEQHRAQDRLVKVSGLMFLAGFVTAGLNHRLGWYLLPGWVSLAAAAVFLGGYLLYAEVLRENTYLSRTIEVQEGRTVVDTGLYAIVRHPMYAATLILFLSMPLVLGSLPAFGIFLVYPFLIAGRIRHEERFLEEELASYRAYKEKVPYRLIPFVW